MSTAATGRFWLCPKCNRHVPIRMDACRCGGTRAEAGAAALAATSPGLPPPVPGAAAAAQVPPPAVAPAPHAFASVPAPRLSGGGELVYANESPLFIISLVLSVGFWLLLVVGTFGLVLFYALMFFVFYLFAQSGLIAYIKGTGVRVTPQQFPDLYQRLTFCCDRLGIQPVPDTYLLHGDGMFNAFATRFLGSNYLVLLADIVDALEHRPNALNFYVGHELGHIHRGHLLWRPALLPASILPLLGAAYHRACEATCDNYGAACCDDPEDAVRGLSALAAGGKRWADLNVGEYLGQARETGGFWMSFHELISDYPWLVKRVARVSVWREGRPAELPGRNPLAYLFALFVPRPLGGGGGGGGLGAMLVVVAMIGIIAAIAIPSLLRARVSANESAALGDVRSMVSAQSSYQSVTGTFGVPKCLATPAFPGCIDGYPSGQAGFLDEGLATATVKNGYRRVFIPGESRATRGNPNGVAAYCYAAYPATQGQTGVRSFGADHTGQMCEDASGENLCAGGELPPGCTAVE